MSMLQEILGAFFLSLGTFELITNTLFLLKLDGLSLARKQHQELPKNISDDKIMIKVIFMLLFGIAFFTVSLISYILHGYLNTVILIILCIFSIYAITEALYYRYWKTTGFACVALVFLSLSIIGY